MSENASSSQQAISIALNTLGFTETPKTALANSVAADAAQQVIEAREVQGDPVALQEKLSQAAFSFERLRTVTANNLDIDQTFDRYQLKAVADSSPITLTRSLSSGVIAMITNVPLPNSDKKFDLILDLSRDSVLWDVASVYDFTSDFHSALFALSGTFLKLNEASGNSRQEVLYSIDGGETFHAARDLVSVEISNIPNEDLASNVALNVEFSRDSILIDLDVTTPFSLGLNIAHMEDKVDSLIETLSEESCASNASVA